MDTALPQKFPFILDRNLAKANCTENRVCTSCDIVVLDISKKNIYKFIYISKNPLFKNLIYILCFESICWLFQFSDDYAMYYLITNGFTLI